MQRVPPRFREEFVAAIQQHAGGNPDKRSSLAQRLLRYGTTYARIQERACNGHQTWNGDWDERAAKRDELKEERLEKAIRELCDKFDCVPLFGGDPRGNTIKIKVMDGYTNDWGREGIGVPTS
jgi:hypothetical protein